MKNSVLTIICVEYRVFKFQIIKYDRTIMAGYSSNDFQTAPTQD